MKVYVEACGCSFSLSDAELAGGLLKKAGHQLTGGDEAEVVVLVTCTVKDATQAKLEKRISELAKSGKKLVVAGCLAQHAPGIVRRLAPEVVLVGPRGITKIADAINARPGTVFVEKTKNNKLGLPRLRTDPVRATVPIAEGCLGECSYCATRLAKGILTSFPRESIICEMKELISTEGYREIWLTAQDCAAWGLDSKGNVCDLLSAISKMDGDFRVRIGMLNPRHLLPIIGRYLEEFSSDKRFFRFFHVPVQSGSDEILALMKRGYSRQDFLSIVSRVRENFPNACLSTDVIAGFPGETEAQFRETVSLLEEVRPDIVNVSRFCARPGTEAATLAGKLAGAKVKARTRALSSLHRKISLEKNKEWIGRTCNVLADEQTPKGLMGRTDEYRPVALHGKAKIGSAVKTKIVDATRSYLIGEISF